MGTPIILPSSYPPIDPRIDRRLYGLENSKVPGLDALGDTGTFSAGPYTPGTPGTFTDIPESHVSFTVTRPSRIFIISNASFYINGGTDTYGYLIHSLVDVSLQSTVSIHTNGAGIANHHGDSDAILPPGDYEAQMWFWTSSVGNSAFHIFSGQLKVRVAG